MEIFTQDCPSGSNPLQLPLNKGGACFALPLSKGSWRGFGSSGFYRLITALLLTLAPTAHADKLGRLFFTPEQRTHLDYRHTRNAPAEGESSPFITVNGIVQKNGGPRTVWVNGVAQSAEGSGERSPTAQAVSISGSRPVKIKVGQKILLDQPVESRPSSSGE